LTNHRNRVLLALFLALLLRLATYPLANIQDPGFFEYGDIATNLTQGNGYAMKHWILDSPYVVPTAWMPPGQVLVLAAFFTAFGKGALAYHLVFLLNALLGAGAVYLLGRISRFVSGSDRLEIITLFAAAVFPPFVIASATWGVACSALFLNSLVMLTALRFSHSLSESKSWFKPALIFGIAAGVLALFRAEAPLTVALILLAIAFVHWKGLGTIMMPVIFSGLVMSMIVSPWLIYNYSRFDRLIPGSSSGAYNLWRGNNPIASGGGWTGDGGLIYPSREFQAEIRQKLEGVDSIEFERVYSDAFKTRALEWMKQNPAKVAFLAVKKAILIWVLDLYHPSNIKYFYAVCQIAAFGLGILGVISIRRRNLRSETDHWLWIAGAACLATTLITMVFFSLPRYQIFLVGLYFPLVALGIERLLPQRLRSTEATPIPSQN
jgi:hypothetical protein